MYLRYPRTGRRSKRAHQRERTHTATIKRGVAVLIAVVVGCGDETPAERVRLIASGGEELFHRLLEADDARTVDPEGHFAFIEGISSPDPAIQMVALRALGRLQLRSAIRDIVPSLSSPHAEVRAEAIDALALAGAGEQPRLMVGVMMSFLAEESDPTVRGATLEALGRLPYEAPADVLAVEDTLVTALATDGGPTDVPDRRLAVEDLERVAAPVLLGAARDLENLVRTSFELAAPGPSTVAALDAMARYRGADGVLSARVRRLALAALTSAGEVSDDLAASAASDPDAQVRRLATLAVGTGAGDDPGSLLTAALADVSPLVRVEAVRSLATRMESRDACAGLLSALEDGSAHVVLEAVDRLSECPPGPALAALEALADGLPSGTEPTWHRAAHAIVALAGIDEASVRSRMSGFAGHPTWQVRMYAARAAVRVESIETLMALASDDHWNVREAAIRGLSALVGHDADSVYVDALRADDPQLVITASGALEGTTRPDVVPRLFDALSRMSVDRRETYRDVRMALLCRIAELGEPEDARRLDAYLEDYDDLLARVAADMRAGWTGEERWARPSPDERAPVPTLAELEELDQSEAVIRMMGGGEMTLALLPFEAPTNVARFARLARSGYFDGLTFHRVVANFVIQGGSPGANEFRGDGPYTRDEVTARSHTRATVGVSTRGRDTGDAQIFVNLVDNPRLDHGFTIFAEVIQGMDVVDGIVEGAVIEEILIRGPATPAPPSIATGVSRHHTRSEKRTCRTEPCSTSRAQTSNGWASPWWRSWTHSRRCSVRRPPEGSRCPRSRASTLAPTP